MKNPEYSHIITRHVAFLTFVAACMYIYIYNIYVRLERFNVVVVSKYLATDQIVYSFFVRNPVTLRVAFATTTTH